MTKRKSKKLNEAWDQIPEVIEMSRFLSSPDTMVSFNVPSDAPVADKIKFELCQLILKFKLKHRLSSVKLASLLDCPPPRVSEILHCRIEKFTIDKLLSYYEKLGFKENPKERNLLSLAGFRAL